MKLILFDCDGTLVDSQYRIIEAMQLSFKDAGFIERDHAAIRQIVGLSLHEALYHLCDVHERQEIERLKQGYMTHYRRLNRLSGDDERLYDGADHLLRRLALQDDVLLGIATGKSHAGVERLIDEHEWHDFFVTIQTADNAPSKPNPIMIEQAIEVSGVKKQHCLMIGDTSFDMEMARSAGVARVGVQWGYHRDDVLLQNGANFLAQDFDALGVFIEDWWNR